MNFTMEQARTRVTMLKKAIDTVNEITETLVEARFMFEMVNANPTFGRGTDPRTGQRRVTTPNDIAENIAALALQRDAAQGVLLGLTGSGSVDDARASFLVLLSAFQRVGQMKELDTLCLLNVPSAYLQIAEVFPAATLRADAITAAAAELDAILSALPPFDLTDVKVTPKSTFVLNG